MIWHKYNKDVLTTGAPYNNENLLPINSASHNVSDLGETVYPGM